ncbi:MAG: DUF4007 family protein [Halanaerobiales bacterium]|nr:DUF4007 family protein [Halanaerobiales bacterium]
MDLYFSKHESFYPRIGWLRKGLDAVRKNNHIFLERTNAMEELGIGSNMVKALRYWLTAFDLTEEKSNSKGQTIQEITELGKHLLDFDEYFEDLGTFWILHFRIAKKRSEAPTWYWFYNHFTHISFNKETFINNLSKYIQRLGEKVPAERSLINDYNVLRRMYLYDPQENITKEKSFMSPFRDLKLIMKEKSNSYKKNAPDLDTLNPKIFFYCLLESIDDEDENINLHNILNTQQSVGKIFNLNMNIIHEFLGALQEDRLLRINKQAGMNSVKILQNDKNRILKTYYRNI